MIRNEMLEPPPAAWCECGRSAPPPGRFLCLPKESDAKKGHPRRARRLPSLAVFDPQARTTAHPCTAREAPLPAAPLRACRPKTANLGRALRGLETQYTKLQHCKSGALAFAVGSPMARPGLAARAPRARRGAPGRRASRAVQGCTVARPPSARREARGPSRHRGRAFSWLLLFARAKRSNPGCGAEHPAFTQSAPGGRTSLGRVMLLVAARRAHRTTR